MRVALLTDGIYPYVMGGMQKHSYYLAKYLCRAGIEVTLYHTNLSQLPIEELVGFTNEEKKNLTSIVVPFPKSDKLPGHYLRASYAYSRLVYEKFKLQKPVDFIYCKGFAGWHLLSIKNKINNLPAIAVNFHGYEMFQAPPDFKSKLGQILFFKGPVRYITGKADIVFSYGSKITDVITSIPVEKSKIREIPTGIEEEWINNQPEDCHVPKKFLFIGRYERRKGIEELHKAIASIPVNNAEFHFIGPIPPDKQLKRSDVVYYGSMNQVSEIKKIVRNCDVLLCPSYSEGMPNVIMEAMASGLAVIATNVGAVNLLVNEKNGILISTNDLIELNKYIKQMIDLDASKLRQMKLESVKLIQENFLWSVVAAMHINVFKDSLK